MLKTIKVNKRMRLDELIKYAWENDIRNKSYRSDNGQFVIFRENGRFISAWEFGSDVLFTVEIEEEITEDTEFEVLVGVYFYDDVGSYNASTFYNRSIDDVKDSEALCVYALINDKLELIWERDDHGSN